MKFNSTVFKDVYVIEFDKIEDERGWFMKTYTQDIFTKNISNFNSNWVQINHSFNKTKNTWRGFHFQMPPFQETKIVRCLRGKAIDFILDLRKGSETFLKVFSLELSEENRKAIYIPKGFAHGFFTLEENTELIYLHDELYKQEHEAGIRYDDDLINFSLPKPPSVISSRDKSHKLLTKNFKGI